LSNDSLDFSNQMHANMFKDGWAQFSFLNSVRFTNSVYSFSVQKICIKYLLYPICRHSQPIYWKCKKQR